MISEAFTTAPEVVYSPTVPPTPFATNRSEPEIAREIGPFSPEISEALTRAPEVVYSLIVPWLVFATNRSEPDTAIASPMSFKPVINEVFTTAPDVVYSAIEPGLKQHWVETNTSEPDTAMLSGEPGFGNEISEEFTVAPEVSYAPIVLTGVTFPTKISSARAVLLKRSIPSSTASAPMAAG